MLWICVPQCLGFCNTECACVCLCVCVCVWGSVNVMPCEIKLPTHSRRHLAGQWVPLCHMSDHLECVFRKKGLILFHHSSVYPPACGGWREEGREREEREGEGRMEDESRVSQSKIFKLVSLRADVHVCMCVCVHVWQGNVCIHTQSQMQISTNKIRQTQKKTQMYNPRFHIRSTSQLFRSASRHTVWKMVTSLVWCCFLRLSSILFSIAHTCTLIHIHIHAQVQVTLLELKNCTQTLNMFTLKCLKATISGSRNCKLWLLCWYKVCIPILWSLLDLVHFINYQM